VSKQITIEPVTRIEGHAKVTIHLDDKGAVNTARFHVMEFRGFEKFMEGRMFWEAPLITPRVCGICSVSHHIASAKACDDLVGVEIPKTAQLLRELLCHAEFVHDHALHIFFLALPDLLLGPDAAPERRNIAGLLETQPEWVQRAISLRKVGQAIIEVVGGRPTHPVTAIPGGVSKPLSHDDRYMLLKEARGTVDAARRTVDLVRELLPQHQQLMDAEDGLATHHTALSSEGDFVIYDGKVKVVGAEGTPLADFRARDYGQFIGEHAEDWSYMKFPYLKPLGYPGGTYRVGPLARLNVNERMRTPLANAALQDFKALARGPVQKTLCYHYARAIGLLHSCERIVELLDDPAISDTKVRIPAQRKAGEGIGIVEAPRGLLIHHYAADEMGKLTKVNLIVATTHNNAGINSSVVHAARAFIKNGKPQEGLLNRIEMAIRAYDPCLSCGTHVMGAPMVQVEIYDADGRVVQTVGRDAHGS